MKAPKQYLLNTLFALVIAIASLLSAAHIHASDDVDLSTDTAQCLTIHNLGVSTGIAPTAITFTAHQRHAAPFPLLSLFSYAGHYSAYAARAPPKLS